MNWPRRSQTNPSPFAAQGADLLSPQAGKSLIEDAIDQRSGNHRVGLLILDVPHLSEHFDGGTAGSDCRAADDALLSSATDLPVDTRIARLGRETLAVIFPALASLHEAERLAKKVVASPFCVKSAEGVSVPLDLRGGLAVSPDHGSTYADLLSRAELALISLRRQRTTRCATFSADMQEDAMRRARLRQDLQSAEADGQFELHYQPQVDLTTDRIVGVEALVRWNHPVLGILMPEDFIASLAQTSAARRIDLWVLEAAAAQAARWNGLKPRLRVATNIFPDRLGPALVDDVKRTLDTHAIAPETLEIEIPERHALHDLDSAAATVHALRRLGVSVALADFGTGSASLTALNALSVNRLKIDRTLVANMLSNGKSVAIVSTLIELGRRIDLSVLAEGIETPEQRDVLQAFGCNEGQGFLFGKAVRADKVTPPAPSGR
jgi:EAL domain-containing protein (putative c-di-GMP-specific phosphodiesterase class I)/GGDEF domain-containing protein